MELNPNENVPRSFRAKELEMLASTTDGKMSPEGDLFRKVFEFTTGLAEEGKNKE